MSAPSLEQTPQDVTMEDAVHPELHGHLSSLAVLHELPDEYGLGWELHYKDGREDQSNGTYSDRTSSSYTSNKQAMENAHGEGTYEERFHRQPDSDAKTAALHAVRNAIVGETTDEDHNSAIDWGRATKELFAKGMEAKSDADRDNLLVSAIVAAQFAPDADVREGLLRTVFDAGAQATMAEACKSSPLVLLTDGPNSPKGPEDPDITYQATEYHPIRSYARVFEIEDERLHKYLAHMPKGQPEEVADATDKSPKRIQKELMTQAQAGEMDEQTQREAETASVSGEKVGETLLDIYKLERFALEQQYIHAQRRDVLAGPDWEHSALALKLAESRQQPSNVIHSGDLHSRRDADPDTAPTLESVIGKLESDTSDAFNELSQPSIEQFSLEGADLSDPASLTEDQRAALRFRTILDYSHQHIALSQYLDYENFVARRDRPIITNMYEGTEIWTTAEDGAAVPQSTTQAILALMQAASAPGAPEATEDELYQAMQANRRMLLGVATHNIEELGDDLDIRVHLTRNDQGKLEVEMQNAMPAKESNEVYAAITLGCPALREISENRGLMSMADRAAYGSSNYVDHAMAAVINEAKARGIFKVGAYALS